MVDVDLASGRESISGPDRGSALEPGSTLKPLILWTALRSGVVSETSSVDCDGDLAIDGHNLACAHPRSIQVLDGHMALAYSCNTFFARLGRQMPAPVLSQGLRHFGIALKTGSGDPDRRALVVLGLEQVRVTPVQLARAYVVLANSFSQAGPSTNVVRSGLLDSVAYGMAGAAMTSTVVLGGKTGTVHKPSPVYQHGWFAGIVFRNRADLYPVRVLVVFVPGGNGADAALAAHMHLLGSE